MHKRSNCKLDKASSHSVKPVAKQRAYSLKQGYVNHIIATIAKEPTGVYGKLIPTQ
jgi:hypothetical protein